MPARRLHDTGRTGWWWLFGLFEDKPAVLHTGCVRRHRSDQDQQRRIHAYLTGAADEETGQVMMALFLHAVIFLLLTGAEAIWVGSAAVRVWRRREAGLTQAARTGVHKPTLVVLLGAHVLYELLRKAGIAKLDRRSIEYLAQEPGRT
jgi:hypothetical protein